jgi:hypothetical protein
VYCLFCCFILLFSFLLVLVFSSQTYSVVRSLSSDSPTKFKQVESKDLVDGLIRYAVLLYLSGSTFLFCKSFL